ncbi:MAG: enterotoxin [Gemmatimonadota bacterium]|nr:enterotoxin [Gemmatimonadota bacterium]
MPADSDWPPPGPPASPGLTRRGFLDRSTKIAIGLGALQLGLGRDALGETANSVMGGTTRAASRAAIVADELTLGNEFIRGSWTTTDGIFRPVRFSDLLNNASLPVVGNAFTLTLADKSVMRSDEMRLSSPPVVENLVAVPGSSRAVERLGGRQITLVLRDPHGRMEATWRGILRDGSSYLRQEITLRALNADVPLREIALLDFHASNAMVTGTVRGTPIVIGNSYFAFEHPLANNAVDGDRVRCRMSRTLPLRPGTSLDVSSVMGVVHPGQMRRDFLRYVERERAHPYRTFLHYNSWYDIGYFNKYTEAEALSVIAAFGSELHDKRGVTLDSFLFDDGWDDSKTLWRFNSGFPDGFRKVEEATHRYGAAPGVWMSPWGGYGQPHEERVAYGKVQGFETNKDGFALSGPVYYKRFRDTCIDMIRKYGVNQFKFDGTGDSSSTFPGSPFDSDFDAAIHLIGELRAEKPDLYVNLTTGTYPSPFWLRYADSIWRGGDDHDFAGIGSSRQRWMTYRDSDTYEHVVRAGALFPMNSLMLHGIIYAKQAHNLMTDPGNDFASEVRDYFGTGTQLQEMYVTPSLLSAANWDSIAECAKWSRANADTLVDTHWVGGDPQRLEPYGWASWSPKKAILTLRNPSNRPQEIAIDVGRIFELPPSAPTRYLARSPWAEYRGMKAISFTAGRERRIQLAPFEVLTLDMAGH